jgi:hypothetical protein
MTDAEAQIGFEQLGLANVLKQNTLAVPPNQREYSWTDREVTQLLQDVAKSLADGEQAYFLGTVVTIPRPSGLLEVVDGQQRLATTAILLASFRDALRGKDDMLVQSLDNEFLSVIDRTRRERIPRLTLNLDDNDFFKAKLTGVADVPATRLSHQRIDEAFKLCAAQVRRITAGFDPKDQGDIINNWIDFLQKKALVILLRVPSDANAYKMFETLNDRGLKTSQADLIKNYLFGRADGRLSEVQQKWALMRGALESYGDEDTVVNFLRHALITINGFVRESQVYDVVQNIARAPQAAVTFAATLEVLSTLYVAIHNPEHERWNKYSDATRHAIEVLNLFDIKPMRPLMLALAARFEPNEAEKAFRFLLALSVRLLIAASTRSGSVEIPLAAAALKVYQQEITDTTALKKALGDVLVSDEQFRQSFETSTVSKAVLARYYLRSLEQVAQGVADPYFIPNADRQTINLEHVFPREPEGNWPQFDDQTGPIYLKRIGNLALMRATENSDLKSETFDEKKKAFAGSPYVLTSQIAEAASWGPKEIEGRQKTLADLAIKAWPL